MAEQDKQLLLKDLLARLLYEVRVEVDDEFMVGIRTLRGYEFGWFCVEGRHYDIDEIKPYLRPMSSMTDEEKQEVFYCIDTVTDENYGDSYSPSAWNAMDYFVSYCDSHYLDHRGLIPMGLALEAPEGMYKTE